LAPALEKGPTSKFNPISFRDPSGFGPLAISAKRAYGEKEK
jgi:hypothetical protein